jgi:hypothetical protein
MELDGVHGVHLVVVSMALEREVLATLRIVEMLYCYTALD